MRGRLLFSLLLPALAACGASGRPASQADARLATLKLPKGFAISIYAEVPGARSMALGPKGTLFVGTRDRNGSVYAVMDADRDGKADAVHVVARGLTMPNGVAVRDGSLYVAEVSRILRFDGIEESLTKPPVPVVVTTAFPTDTHHGWKFIAFGAVGWLYVPVGAPCNVCERDDPRYSSITRIRPDGSGLEVFARGVRNTVGFDWHPETKELWFTDNGRDGLGDDQPPDELNRAPKAGLHFGFPYCHGGDLPDPGLGEGHPCPGFVVPERRLGAHVASLGMRFYRGSAFPAAYRDQVFVAEHGSWNRSRKVGYRVSLLRLSGGRVVSYEPFVEGWLSDEKAWGRPVDVQELPDGSLLVSDDHAGLVYRIVWRG